MIGGAGLLGGPTHGSPPSAGTRSPPGLAAPAGRREPAFRDEDRAWKRSGDERRRAACPSRRLYVNARSAGRSPRPAALPKGYWPDATDCPPIRSRAEREDAAPCEGKFLRGRSGTEPYLRHTTGLQTYAGGNPGHRVQAPGLARKKAIPIFNGTYAP